MITIKRTDSNNVDFIKLVKGLDKFLKIADGDDHEFYNQYNNIDVLNHVVVAYNDDKAIGCGAIKKYDNESTEIKRMFVLPESRGLGIATKILSELEKWTLEQEFKKCVLETGKTLKSAIKMYKINGYVLIPNYGQYVNAKNSYCFEKQL